MIRPVGSDDVHERMGDRRHQSGGGLGRILFQRRMGRSDHEVEFGQQCIVVVEAAVGVDVDFAAGEHADALGRRVDLVDGVDVTTQPISSSPLAWTLLRGGR